MKFSAYAEKLYYGMKTDSTWNKQNVKVVDEAIYLAGRLATDGFHVTIERHDSDNWDIIVLKR